jgi:hypothetical protein
MIQKRQFAEPRPHAASYDCYIHLTGRVLLIYTAADALFAECY